MACSCSYNQGNGQSSAAEVNQAAELVAQKAGGGMTDLLDMANGDGNFSKYLNDYLAGGMAPDMAVKLATVAAGPHSSTFVMPNDKAKDFMPSGAAAPVVATKAGGFTLVADIEQPQPKASVLTKQGLMNALSFANSKAGMAAGSQFPPLLPPPDYPGSKAPPWLLPPPDYPGSKAPPGLLPPPDYPGSKAPPGLLDKPVAIAQPSPWYRDPFVITGIVFGGLITAAAVTAMVVIVKKA